MLARALCSTKDTAAIMEMSKEEFSSYACTMFPRLLAEFNKWEHVAEHSSLTPAAFGIEIERGWRKLVIDLCLQLSRVIASTDVTCNLVRIKGDKGGLRISYRCTYTPSANKDDCECIINVVRALIQMAEESSKCICGELGTPVMHKFCALGWVYDCGIDGMIVRWRRQGISETDIQQWVATYTNMMTHTNLIESRLPYLSPQRLAKVADFVKGLAVGVTDD